MLALEFLVDLVRFGDLHRGHDLVGFTTDQCDLGAGGEFFIMRERDGDRPEGAVGHLHLFTYTLPIIVTHKAIQRSEAADAQHNGIAGFAGAHDQLGKGFRTFQFIVTFLAFKEQYLQRITAMRRD